MAKENLSEIQKQQKFKKKLIDRLYHTVRIIKNLAIVPFTTGVPQSIVYNLINPEITPENQFEINLTIFGSMVISGILAITTNNLTKYIDLMINDKKLGKIYSKENADLKLSNIFEENQETLKLLNSTKERFHDPKHTYKLGEDSIVRTKTNYVYIKDKVIVAATHRTKSLRDAINRYHPDNVIDKPLKTEKGLKFIINETGSEHNGKRSEAFSLFNVNLKEGIINVTDNFKNKYFRYGGHVDKKIIDGKEVLVITYEESSKISTEGYRIYTHSQKIITTESNGYLTIDKVVNE